MQTAIYNHVVLKILEILKMLMIDLLTLGDPVDGDRVGDLHHDVQHGGGEGRYKGNQHREAE